MDFGFLKIGAFSPRTCVANPKQNAIYTLDALRHAQEEGVQVAVLPELCPRFQRLGSRAHNKEDRRRW